MANLIKFEAPTDEYGNPYWVPVVVKNKDWLMAFLYGYHSATEMINQTLGMTELGINLNILEFPLNSFRHNNILKNGQDASKLTKFEYEEYINKLYNETQTKVDSESESKDNLPIPFLTIDCTCGLGFYSFESEEDLPNENLKCSNCGKFVIIYTNINECNFEVPKLQHEEY